MCKFVYSGNRSFAVTPVPGLKVKSERCQKKHSKASLKKKKACLLLLPDTCVFIGVEWIYTLVLGVGVRHLGQLPCMLASAVLFPYGGSECWVELLCYSGGC